VPPITAGSIDAAIVQAGAATTVDVAANFNEPQGEDLTYVASSSDTDVATASNEGSVVSITGVAAGTATISVTATDPTGLSAKQTFMVTVTAADATPTTDPTCGSGALDVKGTCEVEITADQKLESGDPKIVTVALKKGSTTTWVVTAKAKGSTTVRVVNKADGTVAATIQVKVNNQKPERNDKQLTELITMSEYGDDSDPPVTAPMVPFDYDIDMARTYLALVPGGFGSYFKDADGDTLTFEVKPYMTTSVIVREIENEGVVVDVIHKDKDSFQLEVTAMDGEKAMSAESLIVNVRSVNPRSHDYDIEQYASGTLRPETIGLRWGTAHTLVFRNVDWTTAAADAATADIPLKFIADWDPEAKVSSAGFTRSDLDPGMDDEVNGTRPDLDTPSDGIQVGDEGKRHIKFKATGPINVGTYTDSSAMAGADEFYPTLTFTLRGAGAQEPQTGVATITIEYYVIYDADDAAGSDHSIEEHMVDSQELKLTIVRVT
jgi:hypothetical protein